MYNIGDNILYGTNGIMTVVDIRDERLTDEEKTYYVLREYSGATSSWTYVPMDNEKLVSSMHTLLTPDEVYAAIAEAGISPDVEWIPDSRARAEAYKSILRTADRKEILVLIRTVYNTGLRRAAIGKKNFLTDESIMHKAESIIAQEFSISLGVSPDVARRIVDSDVKGIVV